MLPKVSAISSVICVFFIVKLLAVILLHMFSITCCSYPDKCSHPKAVRFLGSDIHL